MRLAASLAALTLALSAATASVAIASQQHESQLKPQPQQAQPADEDTASQNLLRDDWDPNEPGLSPATLQGGHFGQLFATHVDGQVYAQPLVVDDPGTATTAPGSSVIVATENNTVYSIDGTTGKVIWSNHLGTPWSYTVNHCQDIMPDIGITSTPVYNPATHLLYVVADIAGSSSTNPHPAYYVYALSEQTGAVEWRTAVHGPPTNAKAENFVASDERQRAGLLLMNGWLYLGFASFCDYGFYTGFVSGVNITSHAQTMWTDETGSAGNQSGIWMGGGGFMSDGSGRIFLATGNGVSPPPGPGNGPPGELGDSVVRLSQNTSTGALTASDFFSPANAPTLDREDADLGAGGPVGLPFGTSAYPHLMVQAGKDHRIFLLNRDSLGGRETGPGGSDNPVFTGGPYEGQFGHPAAYAGGGGADYVYYSGTGEGGGRLPARPVFQRAFPPAPRAPGRRELARQVRLRIRLAGRHLERRRQLLGDRLGGLLLRVIRCRRPAGGVQRGPGSRPCHAHRALVRPHRHSGEVQRPGHRWRQRVRGHQERHRVRVRGLERPPARGQAG